MNTQQLELHLATSLNGLAKACDSYKKTENTDRIILNVLSDDRLDGEVLLQHISEIKKETGEIICDLFEPQVNLNQLYNAEEPESINQGKVMKGLRKLASNASEFQNSAQESSILQFIYRTLGSLNDEPECKKALNEMGVIENLFRI